MNRVFEIDSESMKYKNAIRKSTSDACHGSTKEYIIFSISSMPNKVKVSFLFDWAYDTEDGFSYKKFHDFSGHKKYNDEERQWLEQYCKKYYPDSHHMSY